MSLQKYTVRLWKVAEAHASAEVDVEAGDAVEARLLAESEVLPRDWCVEAFETIHEWSEIVEGNTKTEVSQR